MCSRASALPESYKRYLTNGIRDAFDLGAAPIRLIVRQNRNPFAEDDP
jgi:GTP-binding protein